MRYRIAPAVLILLTGFTVAVLDAVVVQRSQPRDRIWLLILYSAIPALVGAMAVVAVRSRARAAIFALAAIAPTVVWFGFGAESAEAAFDRLALNPYRFLLAWLPFAAAISLLIPRALDGRSRTHPFGRRGWRFGAAILLLFVAATFTPKGSSGEEGEALIAMASFGALLAGLTLLVSDVLPAAAGAAVREWSWFAFAIIILGASLFAIAHVADVASQRSNLEWSIDLNRRAIREVVSMAKRYEVQGRLTVTDRALVASRIAKLKREIEDDQAELAKHPVRLVAPVLLAVASVGVLVLVVLLLVDEWRWRRRSVQAGSVPEGVVE